MTDIAHEILTAYYDLNEKLLHLEMPAYFCYFPLRYAAEPWKQYLLRYATRTKKTLWVGINPGPWGMAQTGIPFGDVQSVQRWLHIDAPVRPQHYPPTHPKKPILGFSCTRGEVSGKRLWGMLEERYKNAERFFAQNFLLNYCPVAYCDSQGRNITPFQLKKGLQNSIMELCDHTLSHIIALLEVSHIVGIGKSITQRILPLAAPQMRVHSIPHPSPANPQANKDWSAQATSILDTCGL